MSSGNTDSKYIQQWIEHSTKYINIHLFVISADKDVKIPSWNSTRVVTKLPSYMKGIYLSLVCLEVDLF